MYCSVQLFTLKFAKTVVVEEERSTEGGRNLGSLLTSAQLAANVDVTHNSDTNSLNPVLDSCMW